MNLRTNFVEVLIGTCALLSAQCVQASAQSVVALICTPSSHSRNSSPG